MRENGFDFDGTGCGMMQQIVAGGGELACHSYSHMHFYKSKRQEIISELARNQHFIEKLVRSYKLENFWLIFYTHEIEENSPKEGCTPDDLEADGQALL